ncbi:MAG: nucleotide exchange factor GrpE [Saprospiraceae bacterium]|nr:nucleotide exchange factor GrpE [Bacteroidia bacterium]NNL93784.1 nucleotide exchange factor GrpE [Saprospiraceae bacterium]
MADTNKAEEKMKAKVKSKKSKGKKVDKQVEELTQQLEEARDKHLRLFAEFENFKKRNTRERLDLLKNAAQDTMSAILPILDDFDRAKKAAEDEKTEEQLSEGVLMVYNKLYSVLGNKGLKPMVSTGEVFDPEVHEAITEIPAPSEDLKGKVVDTVEKGYYLNDKIIRFAKVVVGK